MGRTVHGPFPTLTRSTPSPICAALGPTLFRPTIRLAQEQNRRAERKPETLASSFVLTAPPSLRLRRAPPQPTSPSSFDLVAVRRRDSDATLDPRIEPNGDDSRGRFGKPHDSRRRSTSSSSDTPPSCPDLPFPATARHEIGRHRPPRNRA